MPHLRQLRDLGHQFVAVVDDLVDAGGQHEVGQLAAQSRHLGGVAPEVDDADRALQLVDHVGYQLLDAARHVPLGTSPPPKAILPTRS